MVKLDIGKIEAAWFESEQCRRSSVADGLVVIEFYINGGGCPRRLVEVDRSAHGPILRFPPTFNVWCRLHLFLLFFPRSTPCRQATTSSQAAQHNWNIEDSNLVQHPAGSSSAVLHQIRDRSLLRDPKSSDSERFS